MSNTKRIVILTATEIESRQLIDSHRKATGTGFRRLQYDTFTGHALKSSPGIEVIHVQCEAGSLGPSGSQAIANAAIDVLDPSAMIMVGICFGLNRQKQALCDVVVATEIRLYEPERLGKKILPRGPRVPVSPALLSLFRSGVLDWNQCPVHWGLMQLQSIIALKRSSSNGHKIPKSATINRAESCDLLDAS